MNTIEKILSTGNTVTIQPRTVGDGEQWVAIYIKDANGNELSAAWAPSLKNAANDALAMLPEPETNAAETTQEA